MSSGGKCYFVKVKAPVPKNGSKELEELEEPPEGSQRFVAFETIIPVTEWV